MRDVLQECCDFPTFLPLCPLVKSATSSKAHPPIMALARVLALVLLAGVTAAAPSPRPSPSARGGGCVHGAPARAKGYEMQYQHVKPPSRDDTHGFVVDQSWVQRHATVGSSIVRLRAPPGADKTLPETDRLEATVTGRSLHTVWRVQVPALVQQHPGLRSLCDIRECGILPCPRPTASYADPARRRKGLSPQV